MEGSVLRVFLSTTRFVQFCRHLRSSKLSALLAGRPLFLRNCGPLPKVLNGSLQTLTQTSPSRSCLTCFPAASNSIRKLLPSLLHLLFGDLALVPSISTPPPAHSQPTGGQKATCMEVPVAEIHSHGSSRRGDPLDDPRGTQNADPFWNLDFKTKKLGKTQWSNHKVSFGKVSRGRPWVWVVSQPILQTLTGCRVELGCFY